MARKRKTFSIAKLLHSVNSRNASSTCDAKLRQGWNSLLETVLMDADVYAGFGYLGPNDVPDGHGCGVIYRYIHPAASGGPNSGRLTAAENYFNELSDLKQFGGIAEIEQVFPDESRRVYYVHRTLHAEYDQIHQRHKGTVIKAEKRRQIAANAELPADRQAVVDAAEGLFENSGA